MAPKITQDNRQLRLDTPFGNDVLCILSIEAREGLSELFDYEVVALSTEGSLNFDTALGKNCCVTFKTHKGIDRHFNGILTGAESLGKYEELYRYRLRLEPWLALLDYAQDCRFFQNMKVTEIIKKVFQDSGFSDFRLDVQGSFDPIEYCVQYRESNLSFVSRLMERFGIFYYFEHSKDKHELVLTDENSALKPVQNLASVKMRHTDRSNFGDEQFLSGWKPTRRFETGKVTLNDYDYLKPNSRLISESSKPGGYTRSNMERYDYHQDFDKTSKGEKFAKFQVEAIQSFDFRREGKGEAPSIHPGGVINVSELELGGENGQYIIVAARHSIEAPPYYGGPHVSRENVYEGHYLFQPQSRQFRAPLRTPKPVIPGLQTAKVVAESGKEGEEIDVDEHGRILVQFHWDRDKKPSRRVRIAQSWSGKAWGGIFIPRIGMEVVVEFVEGDPDYPLVTGTVYNGENAPPYSLPGQKNIAGFKSQSTKNDQQGYNEFVFDDTSNSELIRIHGEKDLNAKIKNSVEENVGEEFMPPVGVASYKRTVHNGDDDLQVKVGNQNVKIGGMQTIEVTQMITIKCGQSTIVMTPASISFNSPMIMSTSTGPTMVTAGLKTETVSGSSAFTTGGAHAVTSGGAIAETAGGAMAATAGGAIAITAGAAITETAGGAINMLAPFVLANGKPL